ncbi:MAG: hypothetical protein QS748_01435 [Candidatus Endonucleobacter bathymodioli]|uniref:Transketolase N-terminal domain-containing protein n=1 Tax=Candidatus Endonucleibacter bathymodioli TaxID=539814 RepID=A0AA90SS28_9GAMM|nr:hypothetical protein [Candidatus Endonucleobacter bathymodioli]
MSTQTKYYGQLAQDKRYHLPALLNNSLSQQTMAEIPSRLTATILLSKGHGSMLLYPLHLTGYDLSIDYLKTE